MAQMLNVFIALMPSSYQMQHTFPLIIGCNKKNWNARGFILRKWNVITVCLLLKLDMRWIWLVKIMSLIQRLCAINVCPRMLLWKDKNIDMLTMCSFKILLRFKILWDIGCQENMNSKEWLSFMDIMQKILIIKEVLELSFKHYISQNKKVHMEDSVSSKMRKVPIWFRSLLDFPLRELVGYLLKLIMMLWWVRSTFVWLPNFKNNIVFLMNLDTQFPISFLWFSDLIKKIKTKWNLKFTWSVIKDRLYKDQICSLNRTVEERYRLE